jgi:putative tricarboxylic transport membrane protein
VDRRIDLIIGILVIALGAAVLFFALDIRPTGPVVDPIGPRAFPYMIGLFFLLGGSRIVLVRLREWRSETGPLVAEEGEPDEPGVPASAAQAFTIMAAAVIYAVTLSRVGYLLMTPLFVVIALKALRLKSWAVVIVTALAYTAVTYIVFAHYLGVDLPLGPLAGPFHSLGLAR